MRKNIYLLMGFICTYGLCAMEDGHKKKLRTRADREQGIANLHLAAIQGDMPRVESLVSRCKNINIVDNEGETALYKAILYGHLDVAQYLIEHNADSRHARYDGQTPRMIAEALGCMYIFDKKEKDSMGSKKISRSYSEVWPEKTKKQFFLTCSYRKESPIKLKKKFTGDSVIKFLHIKKKKSKI